MYTKGPPEGRMINGDSDDDNDDGGNNENRARW